MTSALLASRDLFADAHNAPSKTNIQRDLEGDPAPAKNVPRGDPVPVRLLVRLSLDVKAFWCQNGTMKRMNLRDVPDDVYAVLVAAAESSRQSLSAFVVDRLCEVAQAVRVADYVATYPVPRGTGVTAEDAVAAVREVREAS